jgi:glycosyltransferase involved in cell wall biosynthesis
MGKPVVASRLGAQTETVLEGETGFLFEPGNQKAMAEAMTRALRLSVDERAALVSAARARVEKHYTVDVMCASTLSVYARVSSKAV